jgi:MFS family permease
MQETGASAKLITSRNRLLFGFWAAACSIVAIVIGANTALPILTVYQAEWGFSTGTLSVIYGIYTVGVIAAVFILGPASDLVGRKRILLPAFGVMITGLLLGLAAPNEWVLMGARLLQGVAVGAGVTTAVAALGELAADPADHGRIALTATVATVTGLAGGPLIAGSVAEFLPRPTILPYAVALLLVIAAAIGEAAAPETVAARRPFWLQMISLSIPRQAMAQFALATFVEMTAYAVAGTFAGLGPTFARNLLGVENHFFGGLVVALLFACSAITQLVFKRWSYRRCMGVGLAALLLGLALFAFGVVGYNAVAFLVSSAVLGGGHGLAYLGSQELTDRVAPPDRRAQIFSAFQLGLYVGATLPALILGFAAGAFGLVHATLGFAAIVAGLAAFALAWLRLAPSTRPEA